MVIEEEFNVEIPDEDAEKIAASATQLNTLAKS